MSLTKVKSKESHYHKAKSEYLTPDTIYRIHQLMWNAFNQVVKWELIIRNPCTNATPPKCESKKNLESINIALCPWGDM